MVAAAGICVDRYEYPNRAGHVPRGGLRFEAAEELCEVRGARLCTEEEWIALCSGGGARRWPYGNAYEAGRCQFGVSGAAGQIGQALPAGQKAGCVTLEGVFDLSGNLWEWTATPFGGGVLHGGGWSANSGLGQCEFRATADEGFDAPELGARCCSDGERD